METTIQEGTVRSCPAYIRYYVGGTEYVATTQVLPLEVALTIKQGTKVLQKMSLSSPENVVNFLEKLMSLQEQQKIESIITGPETYYKLTENRWEVYKHTRELPPDYKVNMVLGSNKGRPYPVRAKHAFNLYDHRFMVHRSVESEDGYLVSEYTTGACVDKRMNLGEKGAIKNAKSILLLMGRDAVQKAIKKHPILNTNEPY